MAPIHTQWTRLIRFVASETSRVHIGQPVDEVLDVGLAAYHGAPIKAFEIVGSALDPAAQVTTTVLTVKVLLTPLSREEVKLEEAHLPKPDFPVLFFKPVTSLIGPLAPVTIPKVAQPPQVHLPDYEVELVIVIGKAAKNVSEADALDYVLAYSGANDVSFRKHQMAVSQWGFSKGFDNTNPFGPCLVASRLIPDPQQVQLRTVVNGKILQDGITAVRQTVAFLSQGTTLEPGAIILTGTPKGVGFVKSPPVYLKGGDKMSVWLSNGIGSLYNDVHEEGSGPRSKL
ncbi:hypothetical protein DXG01_006674 [Tephrocybe rancida]|nr:hypothetical protein DXG01_006674 [Tephrocybe rancida]